MQSLFQPGCPWYDLHIQYPPNIDWCEEKLCSWIVTPFNTWTNVAYSLIGLSIWIKMRKSPSAFLRFFGPASFIVGLTSFIYHASLNLFTQVFDFFGMYVFCVLLIMFNLARAGKWPAPPRAFVRFWIWVVGLTAFTVVSYFIHFPIQLYVLFLIMTILVTEFKATAPSRKYFWYTVVAMAVAVTFSALDHAGIICSPENHYFQGHGVWHLLGAVALWTSFQHYRQFESSL